MKNIFFIYLLIWNSISIFAQKAEAIKLTYQITNFVDLTVTGTSDLFILTDNTKSYNVIGKFSYQKSRHIPDGAIHKLPNSQDINNIYTTDFKINELISKENTIDQFFFMKEFIPKFEWKLNDEYKTVNNIKLQKATTTFRGRNYSAWCDLNTPISQGPWKFNNLPGLAYEIFDDALDYHFEWQLIKITEPKEYDFTSYDFSKEKFITQQDFIKTLDYFYKTNEDIASTRLLESLDVEVLGVTHHKINYRIKLQEKKYEWEE